MGCKATKTGVLMKWFVCASIYVLLFGVLNSNTILTYMSHEPSSLFHHSVLVDLNVSMMMH